jgi:chromosome segregation ATPase
MSKTTPDVSNSTRTRITAAVRVEAEGIGETEHQEQTEKYSFSAQSWPSFVRFVRSMDKKIGLVSNENEALKTRLNQAEGELAATQQQVVNLSEKVKQLEEQTTSFTKQQTKKIEAMVEIASAAAQEAEEKMRKAALAALEGKISAKADRIQNLEGRVDKMEEQQEERALTATAVGDQQDLLGKLEKLQELVKQQERTLDAVSTQSISYNSTLDAVKKLGSQVEKVERAVADGHSKAAAAVEKQELLRVLPSVVIVLPKGEKAAAIEGINEGIQRALQEAEDKKQKVPQDLSHTMHPFGLHGQGDTPTAIATAVAAAPAEEPLSRSSGKRS